MATGRSRSSREVGGKARPGIGKKKNSPSQEIRYGAIIGEKGGFFKNRCPKIDSPKETNVKKEPPKARSCAKGKKEIAANRPQKKIFFGLIGTGNVSPKSFFIWPFPAAFIGFALSVVLRGGSIRRLKLESLAVFLMR